VFSPDRSYLLTGWPRTGSSVLAEALTASGRLGVVHEYFWRLVEPMHATELGLDTPTDDTYAPYLEAALRHGTTSNGVFGAKLFWAHAVDLMRRTGLMQEFVGWPDVERLWAPFGNDVRLVLIRRNCLRSALSLWRAEVTQEWGRRPGATGPQPPEAVDLWRVSQLHAEIHTSEIAWESILGASGKPTLEISYEDIASDLTAAVAAVAAFVDIELPSTDNRVATYLRQADDATDRFEAEWIAATGGCQACEANPLRL
jgi:trehalose 2-sulfotransferase